jgi:uncharacterized protein (DUF1778 family)
MAQNNGTRRVGDRFRSRENLVAWLGLRISPELLQRLRQAAAVEHTDVAAFVREAIREKLEREQ